MKCIGFGALAAAWWVASASGQAVVYFEINPSKDVHSISRLIYGVNQPIALGWTNATFERFGGNRTTTYNWVNNASNAGNDWHFVSDDFFPGSTPGAPVAALLRDAFDHDAGALITIPTNGYVAADENGPVDIKDPNRFKSRFKPEAPAKGSAFNLQPDPNEPVVYQDEFVNWVKTNFPYGRSDASRPIYFQLDNEPDIWAETHVEVHPKKLTYAEIVRKTIAYAAAIKHVEPGTLIYGPVNYGWGGIFDLQKAPDANGRDFESYYLAQMARADHDAGLRLLDVLDIHWYPEATGGGKRIAEPDHFAEIVAARLQAPRSLWDPDYIETSWVTHDSLHGQPIRLLPRLNDAITRNYPGTRLSISEYNYGGGADISGAIAEADVLGIFGKFGVFSANEWPAHEDESAIKAGFAMYRNFDGRGGTFGDTSISATTDDVAETSVYASWDSENSKRMVLVAVNKSDHPIIADVRMKDGSPLGDCKVYRLTAASLKPMDAERIVMKDDSVVSVEMPAMSVDTIEFGTR